MERNEIIDKDFVLKMAKEAGLSVENPSWGYSERHHVAGWITDLEAFAKLVAAAAASKEREACAKVCEDLDVHRQVVTWYSQAIRARSTQECCGNPFKCKGNCVDKGVP